MKRKCDGEYMIEENDNLLSISLKCLETEITHFMENNRDFPYMTELLEFFSTYVILMPCMKRQMRIM